MAISWILNSENRIAAKYVGTLGPSFLSLPKHEIEFFLSLLGEVHRAWLVLIRDANEHLSKLVYHSPIQLEYALNSSCSKSDS